MKYLTKCDNGAEGENTKEKLDEWRPVQLTLKPPISHQDGGRRSSDLSRLFHSFLYESEVWEVGYCKQLLKHPWNTNQVNINE